VQSVSPPSHHLRGLPPADYRGLCLRCGIEHRFENDVALGLTSLKQLFQQLEADPAFADFRSALATTPGKMIGVLIAEDASGTRHTLRAYSGELAGRRDWPGWVGPVLRRADTAELEAETLASIAALDRQIHACDVDGAQHRLAETRAAVRHAGAERRQTYRAQRHAWSIERREGGDEAHFDALLAKAKLEHEEAIRADEARVEEARQALLTEREKLHRFREERRDVSRVLSKAIYDAAAVTNARGERRPLREVFVGDGIAGGTTDCSVPKLLEAANVARLRPVALAEAWWGPTLNDRHHGELQAPCERKCQPILGYLLCGLAGQ
jgi:tRNA pseudouridine32 synthase/23S rRNA pseudouridine746 synthase